MRTNHTGRFHAFRGVLFLALAFVMGLGLAGSPVQAQFEHNPFFEHTVALGHAHAAEIIGIRLEALAAFDEVPEGLLDETQKTLTREFPRLHGSLLAVSPGLAADLHGALEEVLELGSQGNVEQLALAIDRAHRLARAAYSALVPEQLVNNPQFVGAVMAKLLVADDGAAEGYEDAAEGDVWEFPNGWAALQRIKRIWPSLKVHASDAQVFEIEDALARLDELLPTAVPTNLDGADPEAGEDPARQAVSTLENVLQAFLYPERELARVGRLVQELVDQGKGAYETGHPELALERVMLAEFYYRENLRRLFDLLMPDVHAQITGAFSEIKADVGQAGVSVFDALLEGVEEGLVMLGN